jgi:CheY-like chemotaxis protein
VSSSGQRTVFLVEDDPGIAASLAEALREEGLAVETAPNGRDALRMLRNGLRPSAIVLDLMMPVMDGLTFLRHVKASVPDRAIPIVLMTAAPGRVPPRAGLPVVAKPIEIHALLDLVRHHCEPESRRDHDAPPRPTPGPPDDPDGFDCAGA